MQLAEALLLRADRMRTYQQLRERIDGSARYQEGEKPPEDAQELIGACSSVLDELERLIRQMNRTNASSQMQDGRSISDALAERDVLRLRYSLLSGAADAASGSGRRGIFQRARASELKVVTDLDIRALRQQAADIARRTRELDAQIQQVNWTMELVEQ